MKKNKKSIAIMIIVSIFSFILFFTLALVTTEFYKVSTRNNAGPVNNGNSKVKIEYVTNANETLGEETIYGNTGEWYETSRKHFENYDRYDDEPLNKKGFFTDGEIVVVYKYIKSDYVSSKVKNDNEVSIDIANQKNIRELDMKIKSVVTTDEGVTPLKNTEFIVKKESDIIKTGKTENNGELYVGTITVKDEIETTYLIEEQFVEGDYIKEVNQPFSVKIIKKWNEQNSKYDVSLQYDKNIKGLDISLDDSEIVITVNHKKNEVISTTDLGLQYFVKSIDGVDANRNPHINIEENGNISLLKETETLKCENNQKILCEIRLYNLDNTDTLGKSIKVKIPNGLKFNKDDSINSIWKMYKETESGVLVETENCDEANYLISDKLSQVKINGFDKTSSKDANYKSVEVSFIVNEGNLGTERNINTTAEIVDNVNDVNKNNDKDEENLYVKYFDLQIEKYIESIEVNVDGESKTHNVGFDKKSQITKIDVPSSKLDKTKLNITYGIKVTNIGEIAGIPLEITDYIPDGLTFDSSKNENWYKENDCIKTTILNNKKLQPGESETVTVILDWNLNKSSIGEKINNAEISVYYNDSDSKDITDDNKDSKSVIVTVKTGAVTYTITIFTVLCVATIVTYTIKRNRKGGVGKHDK